MMLIERESLAARDADIIEVIRRAAWVALTANWDLVVYGETIH